MEQRKIFFADFGFGFFFVFVKISKKMGAMQKPAAHQKTNFSVLRFFYDAIVYIGKSGGALRERPHNTYHFWGEGGSLAICYQAFEKYRDFYGSLLQR
jgi:hypothetical protein